MTEVEPVDRMEEDDDDGLGAGFFVKIAAICLAIAIGAVIVLGIFWRILYALGFFAGFLAIGVLLILFAWIYDRRNPRSSV